MKLKKLAENLEMEADEFLELMKLFSERSASDLKQCQAGINEGDSEKVITATHSIKGAAINLGLVEIYEVAKETEKKARESQLDRAAEGLMILREKLDQIAENLQDGKTESEMQERRDRK